jgi:hypothetical protein
MIEQRLVRHVRNGIIFEAIHYGHEDGTWTKDCITKVAAFVIGLDPDVHATVENERMLDLVLPLIAEFDIPMGKTPIEVADPDTGLIFRVELGDWILKNPYTSLVIVKPEVLKTEYVDVAKKAESKSENDVLADLIYSVLPYKGDIAISLSKQIAETVITNGWSKK